MLAGRSRRVRAVRAGTATGSVLGVCFTTDMSESGHLTPTAYAVGDRVQLRTPDGAGVLVEDYAASGILDSAAAGREWALARRWAVALDDGRLVFADDSDIEAIGATPRRGTAGA